MPLRFFRSLDAGIMPLTASLRHKQARIDTIEIVGALFHFKA